jgi:DNA invertase Pin-like site-specific DNA recombinase/transposase-like protein
MNRSTWPLRGQPESYLRIGLGPCRKSYLPWAAAASDHTCTGDDEEPQQSDFDSLSCVGGSGSSPDSDAQQSHDTNREHCVIYVRRSDGEGKSVEEQKKDLRKKAEEYGFVIVDTVVDDAKTGTNFDRSGFRKVMEYAKSEKISYILVDHISRLGRNSPETIYFFDFLKDMYNVEIITEHGPVNIKQVDDLIQTTIRALMSHISTQYRIRSALRSRISNFVDRKIWRSWRRTIPLGYQEEEEGEWIEIKQDEVGIVQDIFSHIREHASYAGTAEKINNKHSDKLEEKFTGYEIKRIVQDPVYIGEPTIDVNVEWADERDLTVNDPALQIIGQEKFEKVQEIVEKIAEENSAASDGETLDPKSAAEQFSLFAALSSTPILKLHCPECDGEMVKNGQRELDGSINAHNYICKECGTQRKWPYLDELEKMKEEDYNPFDEADEDHNDGNK